MMSEDKEEQYRELHSAARHYNTKLWTIPALFMGVVGFIFSRLHPESFASIESFASLENLVLFLGGEMATYLLLIQFSKDAFFQMSIQKEINRMEGNNASPLYSATDMQFLKRFKELECDPVDPIALSGISKFLIKRRISSFMKFVMISFFVVLLIGIFFIVKFIFCTN